MFKNLTPRSIAALAVVAASFFLMVCVARYGGDALADPKWARTSGMAARTAAWLVETVGAGLWVLLVLPMAWGVIVYFDERTPDLLMRFVGTVLLAVATSGIVGLLHGGVWAGHVGNAVAGALSGFSDRLGGFGTALAWLVELTLLGVSLMFATDWMFHSLRRAGRAAANAAPAIAVEPPAALLEDPAQAEPREFVGQTPRAAVAAAELQDSVEESSTEASTPRGWQESEDEGRTVISAPSGYRGVEFLAPSDELATPETLRTNVAQAAAVVAEHEPAELEQEPLFRDEEFVATSDAAYFAESPTALDDASESETQDIEDVVEAETPADDLVAEDPVAQALQTLLEAIATPEPVAESSPRAGGIGLPEASPFLDEFFAVDAGWPYAPEPLAAANDGASAANEMASSYASAPSPTPMAERVVTPSTAPAAEDTAPVFEDEIASIDDDFVSRLPMDAFDELIAVVEELPTDDLLPAPFEDAPAFVAAPESAYSSVESAAESASSAVAVAEAAPASTAQAAPAAVAEPVVAAEAAPLAEPAPQLTLFAEPVAAAPSAEPPAAPASTPELDLSRLHAMEVDPMFQDAVAAVLERGRASAVVLQRQLGIGYARGIRILDQMTAAGLVGPDTPTGSREIRLTKDAWAAFSAA